MNLLMYVDGNYISSIAINPNMLNRSGYLTYLKQELIKQNSETVEEADQDPQFYLDGVPSSMNSFGSFDVDDLIKKAVYPRSNKNNE